MRLATTPAIRLPIPSTSEAMMRAVTINDAEIEPRC